MKTVQGFEKNTFSTVAFVIFDFFNPSQLTFIASRKCLIYKEILRTVGFKLSAKPLISLKKLISSC
jgi:hypothetical protein